MRHSLAVVLLILFSLPATGQEADTLVSPSRMYVDSLDRWQHFNPDSAEFKPLWASDTIVQVGEEDTLVAVAPAQVEHSPSKAIIYALALPGLGQAYNNKYWKMPIVWAALGGAGYAIWYNTGMFNEYSLLYATDPVNTDERYLTLWRRYRDMSYIAMAAVYALQVLDAYVDAQLFFWDVDENLSLEIGPSIKPLLDHNSLTGASFGLTCRFNLKAK